MYILIISRGVPTPTDPHWGCFEKDQAEALAKLGHKVVIISIDSRFRWQWRTIGITHHHSNDIDFYNTFYIPGAFTRLFGLRFSLIVKQLQFEHVYNKIKNIYGKPDIIYGHFFFNSHMSIPVVQREHIPLINIEHAGRFSTNDLDYDSKKIAAEVYRTTTAEIAVSNSLKLALQNLYGINCYVVNNMFSDDFSYHNTPKETNMVHFVATCRLVQSKGLDTMIRAFNIANLPNDSWHLDIIGFGPEFTHLHELINNFKLESHVTLLGAKEKHEIISIYQKSDIFVLPSRLETFGVAYIEAMACGLPVIATPCGGPEEFVNEKNGLLVPVDDVDALADAIQYTFEHHIEYDRQAISEDCQNRFSSEVIAKQLTEIFERVIKNK